jgi:hypothetical protein
VRLRETRLAVVVVVDRVIYEVLYTFFVAPSTPLHSCQTLVLANVRQAPRPLHCPLTGTSSLSLLAPRRNPRGSSRGPSSPALGSLHRRLAPLRHSSLSPSLLPSRWHARESSCGTASCSGSPRSQVRGVVRCLAPHWHSSSSLSPHLMCIFSRKVMRLSIQKEERGNIWDGGGSSQCRRGLANPDRFVGWCTGNGYLI